MQLRNVSFDTWLQSPRHSEKAHKERWLRELYPWPVLAQVDCDMRSEGRVQRISYDGADYEVTLLDVLKQERQPPTIRYRLRVESDGLGWHSRSFSDEFDMIGSPDGAFVTLFHKGKEEPLEKIARAFFGRRWGDIDADLFRTLAVSRFLAASIVAQGVEQAFQGIELKHYPGARLVGGVSPMFARGNDLWVGHRFYSEDAHSWARRAAGSASRVVALYFADTKYQFRTDLPAGAEVQSIAELDATELGGEYEEFISVLLRGLELPGSLPGPEELKFVVLGRVPAPPTSLVEADVHEALAALKRPCASKSELRYQLAAGVVLNAWIEDEVRLGFFRRRKFYAFKQQIGKIISWAAGEALPGVRVWAESVAASKATILYARIDDVDFSFHAIPGAEAFHNSGNEELAWSGVRLKPIAPVVLAWARALRSADDLPQQPQQPRKPSEQS